MNRLEAIRALLESHRFSYPPHREGCEAAHIDCAAFTLLDVAEAANLLKVDVDANEGERWPHLWKRLEAALDKLTVEMPE